MSAHSVGRSAATQEDVRSAATQEVSRSTALPENDRSAPEPQNARSGSARQGGRSTTTRAPRRSAAAPQEDRSFLCIFTFTDGRQCRSPRKAGHPYLCAFHARKDAQALAGEEAGKDIAYHLSGGFLSAGDLSSALGRLFAAVAQGHMKPKTAATLAYLGQTLLQTMKLSQHEYVTAFGFDNWVSTVRNNQEQSEERISPTPKPDPTSQPDPQPAAVANPSQSVRDSEAATAPN